MLLTKITAKVSASTGMMGIFNPKVVGSTNDPTQGFNTLTTATNLNTYKKYWICPHSKPPSSLLYSTVKLFLFFTRWYSSEKYSSDPICSRKNFWNWASLTSIMCPQDLAKELNDSTVSEERVDSLTVPTTTAPLECNRCCLILKMNENFHLLKDWHL